MSVSQDLPRADFNLTLNLMLIRDLLFYKPVKRNGLLNAQNPCFSSVMSNVIYKLYR